jgi:SAM-dependent methyltransferase
MFGPRKWHLRLLKSSAKALLPFSRKLRQLKRRIAPYQTLPLVDAWLLEQGLRQITMLCECGAEIRGRQVLELGSGWHPVVPILFRLAGAAQVTLTDLEELLDPTLIEHAFRYIHERRIEIASRLQLDENQISKEWTRFKECAPKGAPADSVSLGFRYIVPFRIQDFASDAVDIVVSRAVLEHIPVAEIGNLLTEFKRVLRPGGLMCHIIDNSDHWEHSDKGISRVNFLRYSDLVWGLTGLNRQNYQNRLRHCEYLAMLRENGFGIVTEIGEIDADALEDLNTLPIASRFRAMETKELARLTSYIVAEKPIVS